MKGTTVDVMARLDADVVGLQNQLLDHSGHVRRGLPRKEAMRLIRHITVLRERLGWEPLDMTGRWRRR